MSRKPWNEILEPDRLIRTAKPPGMDDGVHVTIEYFTGFELFNTSPYHNYETFSGGYKVSGLGVTAQAEDLDDAVRKWFENVNENKKKNES